MELKIAAFLASGRKVEAPIFVENLNVKGMDRHLSRAIHDVGWSELRRQLEYKSLLNGSVLTVRDPFYASSKTCSECGYGMEVLPLSVREWTCPACQTTHDRDVNAAINLKQNTVGYTGINAWGQEGSGLAGTASENRPGRTRNFAVGEYSFSLTRKIAALSPFTSQIPVQFYCKWHVCKMLSPKN